MGSREKLLILVLSVTLSVSLTVVFINNPESFQGKIKGTYKPGTSYDADRAVEQSKNILQDKKKLGIDLTDGPCLTNDLFRDWVADTVHVPRTKEDDLPENQCAAYLEGRSKHFVELDLQGNVVRVY